MVMMKNYTHLTIAFQFDCCPDENYWYITERKSGKIYLSRSYESETANSFLNEDFILPADKEYTLTMYDKRANGLESGAPYYEVYSGIAEEGWIQRALIGRVTGNFGFSLEHKIPMTYQANLNVAPHHQIQYEYHPQNKMNQADLLVMLTCLVTFLMFGFIIGVSRFGREFSCKKQIQEESSSPHFSDLVLCRGDDTQ